MTNSGVISRRVAGWSLSKFVQVHRVLLSLALFLLAVDGRAANRTICFELILADDRFECPESGVNGARRPCNPTAGKVNPVGHLLEVWDQDQLTPEGADEYIGTWVISATGRQCITFPWEGQSYAADEGGGHPDLYFRYINRVKNSNGSGPMVRAVQDNGSEYPIITSEPSYFVLNCTGTCEWVPPGVAIWLIPEPDSNHSIAIQSLDSVQHTLQIFSSTLSTSTITMEFPDSSAGCTTGCATSTTRIGIPSVRGKEGWIGPHEVGHIVQWQQFVNQSSGLRNDLSLNGAGWDLDIGEYDSGATTEGWASYVSAVSWWSPDNADSNPTAQGFSIEEAVPFNNSTCSANRGIPLQVARGFWDLNDVTNEDGEGVASGSDDESTWSSTGLAEWWDAFPDGFADHDDFENNIHGVNMYDYFFNATLGPFSMETALDHNCTQTQAGSF